MASPEPLARASSLIGPSVTRALAALGPAVARAADRDFLRAAGPLTLLQRKALSAVTPGAAIRMLASGRSLDDFFEQVEYNGRRLAKLDLPPAAVLAPLRDYARRLRFPSLEAARPAIDQLNFAILLTLGNAFHEVGQAEAALFTGLARAELDARSVPELLSSSAAVLCRYARASGCELIPAGSGAAARRAPRKPRYQLTPTGSLWSFPVGALGQIRLSFPSPYPWLPRECRILSGAAGHILLAWEKQRLASDLALREQRLGELSAHLASAADQERRRIARELHDETGQVLLYLRLKLEMLEKNAPRGLRPPLAEVRRLASTMVSGIRRIISGLTPSVLESAGLPAAVRRLVARFRRSRRASVRLTLRGLGDIPEDAALLAYRLIQESLSNAARHSYASALKISLTSADNTLRLAVKDNGVGFDVAAAARKPGSFGLAGMEERVRLAGGRLSILSRPGHGAAVLAEIPLSGQNQPGRAPRARKPAAAAARSTEYGKNPRTAR